MRCRYLKSSMWKILDPYSEVVAMKIKFIRDQEYQLDAINSIVDIFQGQAIKAANFTVSLDDRINFFESELGIGNLLELTDEELLYNINNIQMRNGLPKSTDINGRNFTVEMETGTGKTYVYTRTIYELNKTYGFTKFIIVVPSVAIREGVYKSLEITREHFGEIYQNQPCNYFIYDSSKLDQIRNFATSSDIEIMIINIDAFRKSFEDPEKINKANIIHRNNDRMNGRKPIEFIAETNPIVIIDEPQSVDNTDKAKEAIASLNPLCILRYSATHRERYNLMYRLDPVDAYEKKLVKQIQVSSIKAMDNFNKPYIKLLNVSNKNGYKAKVEMDVKNTKGIVKRVNKTIKLDDELYDISGERDLYEGYVLSNIDCMPGYESIEFTNGVFLQLGQSIGDFDPDDMKRQQIKAAIEAHLDKERYYIKKSIKVLSLFFIDRVENYRYYDEDGNAHKGKYAKMFEKEYESLINLPKYRNLFNDSKYMLEYDSTKVHDGYFSVDNKGRAKNTKGDTQADYDTYSLIMKDKEKLLSFETPLRFIFSHSALKEGWDNPNVFGVCTLVEARDTLTKRQKIGRGLRLCVNQEGERVSDPNINILTVMANESFADFAEGLQKEIEDETGVRFGIIEKHSFASISYVNEDGDMESFGYDNSEKVWSYLLKEDYIIYNGKVTDKLKLDINNNSFKVEYEYKPMENKIIDVIKKSTAKLNIKNKEDEISISLNKAVYLSDDFNTLWDRIKQKTVYSINIDMKKLIEDSIFDIKTMPEVSKQRYLLEKNMVGLKKSGVIGETVNIRYMESININESLPDLIRYIQDETKLTRKTVTEIIVKSGRLEDFKANPQKYMEAVVQILRKNIRRMMLDGVKYERAEGMEYYKQEIFEESELKGDLNINVIDASKSIYDKIVYDSNIEKTFAERLEKDEDVKLYAKLPGKFLIETPIGDYNPDWAVLIEKNGIEKLYFVIETKGTTDEEQLRFTEDAKIVCGRKHFAALETGIQYHVTDDYFKLKGKI